MVLCSRYVAPLCGRSLPRVAIFPNSREQRRLIAKSVMRRLPDGSANLMAKPTVRAGGANPILPLRCVKLQRTGDTLCCAT